MLGTAFLAGIAAASFSFLAARIIGVSATIATIVTGITAAVLVGYFIHRHGRPNEEL